MSTQDHYTKFWFNYRIPSAIRGGSEVVPLNCCTESKDNVFILRDELNYAFIYLDSVDDVKEFFRLPPEDNLEILEVEENWVKRNVHALISVTIPLDIPGRLNLPENEWILSPEPYTEEERLVEHPLFGNVSEMVAAIYDAIAEMRAILAEHAARPAGPLLK